MSTPLIIIGIVIGGIATLVTVIFMIISLATGKNKNAVIWAIAFVFALSVLILSVFQVLKRLGEKVKSGIDWIDEHKNDGLTHNADNEEYNKQERGYFLDTLKKYTNPSHDGNVPADYYDNKPAENTADGKIMVPFVYPLSIRYSPTDFNGELLSDVNDSVYLKNISQMAFDENFVIAKCDNTNDKEAIKAGKGEIEYVLFDLRSREYLPFVSEQQLVEKAGKIGYAGPQTMTYLTDLYRGWIETLNFDY